MKFEKGLMFVTYLEILSVLFISVLCQTNVSSTVSPDKELTSEEHMLDELNENKRICASADEKYYNANSTLASVQEINQACQKLDLVLLCDSKSVDISTTEFCCSNRGRNSTMAALPCLGKHGTTAIKKAALHAELLNVCKVVFVLDVFCIKSPENFCCINTGWTDPYPVGDAGTKIREAAYQNKLYENIMSACSEVNPEFLCNVFPYNICCNVKKPDPIPPYTSKPQNQTVIKVLNLSTIH